MDWLTSLPAGLLVTGCLASGSQPIHTALRDYLQATRATEWRDAPAAEGDPGVAATVATLERVVRAEAARTELGTPTSTELLVSLDAVTGTRRQRVAAAAREIPVLYVITLVVGGMALIANAGALSFRSSLRTSLIVAGLAVVVGLSLALLFSLGAPWQGSLVVSGQPMDAVVRDLQSGFFESAVPCWQGRLSALRVKPIADAGSGCVGPRSRPSGRRRACRQRRPTTSPIR